LVSEKKVKELQERVGHLMINTFHHVIPENEGSSRGRIVKAVKGLEGDIEKLLR